MDLVAVRLRNGLLWRRRTRFAAKFPSPHPRAPNGSPDCLERNRAQPRDWLRPSYIRPKHGGLWGWHRPDIKPIRDAERWFQTAQ